MFSFLRRKGPIFLGDPSFLETHFTKMPKKKIDFLLQQGPLKKDVPNSNDREKQLTVFKTRSLMRRCGVQEKYPKKRNK